MTVRLSKPAVVPAAADRVFPVPVAESTDPLAIIDIGSNSIRLVIWQGAVRAPSVMFNEKVMAGLGRTAPGDPLPEEAICRAAKALARFTLVAQSMGVTRIRAVATAAVRDAPNRDEFVARMAQHCGIDIEILSGEAEAESSALGVISAIPEADGIVGDLGGGSLELIRVAGGEVRDRISVPLGSLRLAELQAAGPGRIDRALKKALKNVEWLKSGADRPFYAVGGSWRALAHIHMDLAHHPMPMVHHYEMSVDATNRVVRTLAQLSPKNIKKFPNVSGSRAPTLPGAAILLATVVRQLRSSKVVTSAWGLREGLLFRSLDPAVRKQDPLISAARAEGERMGRLAEHGDQLDDWISPVFPDDSPEDRRLRHAACLLGDIAWRAHPDFRAARGLDAALHGNWVGVDARGRSMLATALFTDFGGSPDDPLLDDLKPLLEPGAFERARRWGLAIRLAHRLGGGSAAVFGGTRLVIENKALVLALSPEFADLYGEAIMRRHKGLAAAMGCEPRLVIG